MNCGLLRYVALCLAEPPAVENSRRGLRLPPRIPTLVAHGTSLESEICLPFAASCSLRHSAGVKMTGQRETLFASGRAHHAPCAVATCQSAGSTSHTYTQPKSWQKSSMQMKNDQSCFCS